MWEGCGLTQWCRSSCPRLHNYLFLRACAWVHKHACISAVTHCYLHHKLCLDMCLTHSCSSLLSTYPSVHVWWCKYILVWTRSPNCTVFFHKPIKKLLLCIWVSVELTSVAPVKSICILCSQCCQDTVCRCWQWACIQTAELFLHRSASPLLSIYCLSWKV